MSPFFTIVIFGGIAHPAEVPPTVGENLAGILDKGTSRYSAEAPHTLVIVSRISTGIAVNLLRDCVCIPRTIVRRKMAYLYLNRSASGAVNQVFGIDEQIVVFRAIKILEDGIDIE